MIRATGTRAAAIGDITPLNSPKGVAMSGWLRRSPSSESTCKSQSALSPPARKTTVRRSGDMECGYWPLARWGRRSAVPVPSAACQNRFGGRPDVNTDAFAVRRPHG